jgi:hypothetical protein
MGLNSQVLSRRKKLDNMKNHLIQIKILKNKAEAK